MNKGKGEAFSPWSLLIPAQVLWLLSHPYAGIYHDAQLYAVIAAHWGEPRLLANDLLFVFGSQGDLSLFTTLYAWAIKQLGLDMAAKLITLGGGLAWIVALACAVRSLLGSGVLAGFALLFGVAVSLNYSPNDATFVLNENFATARSIAIPLSVLAAAGLFIRKERLALLVSLASLCLHPLIGIWPLALTVSLRLRDSWLAAFALLAIATVMLVGWLDPALPLVHHMAADRLESLKSAGFGKDVLVGPLGIMRLEAYLNTLACLFLASQAGAASVRMIARNLMLMTATAWLCAMLVANWWPIELLVQVQMWRVFSLALPIGCLVFLHVVQRAGVRFQPLYMLLCLVAPILLMYPGLFAPLALLLGIAVRRPILLGQMETELSCRLMRYRREVLLVSAFMWLLALPGLVEEWTTTGYQMSVPWWHGADWLHGLVVGGVWPLPLLLAYGLHRRTLALPLLGTCLVLLMPIAAHWDHRSQSRREIEHCYLNLDCPPHSFARFVRSSDVVFWKDMELAIWFRLNAASYMGKVQGTGQIFSEERSREWVRRSRVVETAKTQAVGYAAVCIDPLLDWVVVNAPIPGFEPRMSADDGYLYSCADFRAVSPAPTLTHSGESAG